MKEPLASPSAGSKDTSAVSSFFSETRGIPGGHSPSEEHAENGPPFDYTKDAQETTQRSGNIFSRLFFTTKDILASSYVNVLLLFVPVGIAVGNARNSGAAIRPGLVFGMNSIAIIPLAYLLSFATETMAARRGPAVGALMNVTFGNAVELIIFIIALIKDEIRIVQASLLGSILANLLLILGMCFLLGGLRFREQVYNPTVTQTMSCLLSLSVISLVLPTAFHASFQDNTVAKRQDLKISRITSVVLLAVYILYLVFQLKTHAYMYKSLPQSMIDEEAQPGPVAAFLLESPDQDAGDGASDHSNSGMESVHSRKARSRRALLRLMGRNRKASNASSSPTLVTTTTESIDSTASTTSSAALSSPSQELPTDGSAVEQESIKRLQRRHKHGQGLERDALEQSNVGAAGGHEKTGAALGGSDGAYWADSVRCSQSRAGAGLMRTFSAPRPRPRLRKALGRSLAPGLLSDQSGVRNRHSVGTRRPTVRVGVRRTASLPGRLSPTCCRPCGKPQASPCPSQDVSRAACEGSGQACGGAAAAPPADGVPSSSVDEGRHLSTRAATFLLLVSTGLVAYCAELMVGAISDMLATPSSPLGEAFIGLIVLPIVGNAAEHVTAITVALKNKLDLAIAVSIGSSIQIALFVTPFIVILGWTLDREMTLKFTLFETVCLFLAAFITNFLVLDGRSNYLEGALLLAAYVIIAVVAFYYPSAAEAAAGAAGDH